MLQVFYIDVAKVDWDVALVAKCFRCMLQTSIQKFSSVSEVCCKCFIWLLHIFQWLYTYVARVYSKYFICFRFILFIWMLHILQWLYTCCNHVFQMFHLFQTYVAEVIHVATLTGAGSGHMRRRSRMRAASKVIVGSPYLHALPQTPTRNNMRTLMRRRAGMCSSGSSMRGRRSRWGRRGLLDLRALATPLFI
jgi:hypothetical protein